MDISKLLQPLLGLPGYAGPELLPAQLPYLVQLVLVFSAVITTEHMITGPEETLPIAEDFYPPQRFPVERDGERCEGLCARVDHVLNEKAETRRGVASTRTCLQQQLILRSASCRR